MNKLNIIDLFAGCGGLSEGFKKVSHAELLAAVEWEKAPVNNLINRLHTRWNYGDAESRVMQFDIQRINELFEGWSDDPEYGTHAGLNNIVGSNDVDLIIGGPPCQAYSVAGRIRDEHGMKNDYRNYLFEGYMKVVDKYRPKAFVFENVQGMLSAQPGDTPVTTLIKRQVEEYGYELTDNLEENALIDLSEYGVPQKRKRVIILGLNKEYYQDPQTVIKDFYQNILPQYKEKMRTVDEAISDLPPIFPAENEYKINGRKYSHLFPEEIYPNHEPRYHNSRDLGIFKELASDIASGEFKYISSEALKQLYTERTGKTSQVHKYYVLRRDQPSNTIPAHLYKDGLRHIHPDPEQARSITVREAARLQTFDDDYRFISSVGENYKMIGNAVPPKFSEKIAGAVSQIVSHKYIENNQFKADKINI